MSELYIVGTPIGNLQDFSPRAVKILQSCDLILAEDTRHSIYLLKSFNIKTPLKSYHQHNENKRADEVLELLKDNIKVALITDAGMPMISDPGYILVKHILKYREKYNINLSVIPGPTALTSAISLSGIDCQKFNFEGFLPSKEIARLKSLEDIKSIAINNRAVIVYEAPHRLLKTLDNIKSVFTNDHIISVIKEITKQYETVYHGKVADVIDNLSKLPSIKGEFVIIISGLDGSDQNIDSNILKTRDILLSEDLTNKQAVSILAKLYDSNKNYIKKLIGSQK